MWSLKEVYLSRKGFTLIELIVSIALTGILITCIYSLLIFTEKVSRKSDDIDLLLFNGRYAMEYIKGEIGAADRIICSSKFTDLDRLYPSNIGFVSVVEEPSYDRYGKITSVNYNYRTYYQKNDELFRIAYNTPNKSLFEGSRFSGHNQITDGLRDMSNSLLDPDNNIIRVLIELERGEAELVLESTINIRCPVE